MKNFCGYEIELFATEALTGIHGVSAHSGIDFGGGHWLIVRVDDDPDHLVWICAPVSSRALSEVASGRAEVSDVLRHSATGTVEVVTVDHGHAVPDQCLVCSEIPTAYLPLGDLDISSAA